MSLIVCVCGFRNEFSKLVFLRDISTFKHYFRYKTGIFSRTCDDFEPFYFSVSSCMFLPRILPMKTYNYQFKCQYFDFR